MAINWKEAARNYRFQMMMADEQERRLKRRLWVERAQRVALVNTMTELLPEIAVCSCIGPHVDGCLYIKALEAVTEAGREPEECVTPTAITFTCHHCGDFFDEPMEAFIATAAVAVLAPTLCPDCGHGAED